MLNYMNSYAGHCQNLGVAYDLNTLNTSALAQMQLDIVNGYNAGSEKVHGAATWYGLCCQGKALGYVASC